MEFFDMFDGNIPSIIAIAVVVLGGALINNGYLSKLLKARKTKTSEDNDALKSIDAKVSELSGDVARLSRRINHVDKFSLKGNIHTEGLHIIDRLRAFDCYLRIGGNGLVIDYAVEELIIENPACWLRVQQENHMEPSCEKYEARIAEINKRINKVARITH